MSLVAVIHVTLGCLALLAGTAILPLRKGTMLHRQLGYIYILAMLGLNVTALLIYRLFGSFGPFHALALASLATLLLGCLPVWFRRPADRWLVNHYFGMGWSYVGLLAATAAEIAVRLPLARRAGGSTFFAATFFSSFAVVFVGGWLLMRLRRRTLAPFPAPPREPRSQPDSPQETFHE